MPEKEIETFYATSIEAWRSWLLEHHRSRQSIWLIYFKKQTNQPTLSWSDAVDEALCFGWIDSTKVSIDADSFRQFFCPRKARSNWSKVNKNKVEQLIATGRMTQAGLDSIAIAKQNGSWSLLDAAEELTIPNDLEAAFLHWPGAKDFFLTLSKSARKSLLQWLLLAKRAETREKRIAELAELAAQQLKPKQFR
jgi:uncharacterized protein YdeI (YjbR/CyaY-like superfamily)